MLNPVTKDIQYYLWQNNKRQKLLQRNYYAIGEIILCFMGTTGLKTGNHHLARSKSANG
jgi:hypothetical protein